jgi:chemotaxis signal transduction protein
MRTGSDIVAQDFDLLVFQVETSLYAVSASIVLGATEASPLTPIPFSPAPFEGLVCAFGQVLPQIDLGYLLSSRKGTGKILIGLSHSSGSVALRVDRAVKLQEFHGFPELPETGDLRPISGYYADGDNKIALLDLDRVLLHESMALTEETSTILLGAVPDTVAEDPSAGEAAKKLLTIRLGQETLAVQADAVDENLVIEEVAPLHGTPTWISGIVVLRGQPVLALSLPALLGRTEPANEVGLLVSASGNQIILLANACLHLVSVPESEIYAFDQPISGMKSYYIRDEMLAIGIVDITALLAQHADTIAAWIPHLPPKTAAEDTGAIELPRQFLTVRIGKEICAFALERVHRIESDVILTPLPGHHVGFDGLAETSEGVVPVLDLRKRTARAEGAAMDAYAPCLLASLDGGIAGLMVDQVLQVEDAYTRQLEPAVSSESFPVTHILRLQATLAPVVALERLLPPL